MTTSRIVRRAVRVLLALVAALATFSISSTADSTLPNEIYIWQRTWTPSLGAAIASITPSVAGFRVLVAEANVTGKFVPVSVDWSVLASSRRRAIAVFRIDGALPLAGRAHFIRQIGLLARRWPPGAIQGIEIDYDCATSQLSIYGKFLKQLRVAPGLPAHLSVTALPAWLGADSFLTVLAATDEIVLQVHAVRGPRAGLFEPRIARAWVNRLDALDTKPFRVALPDYGVRVIEDERQRIVAVESEAPRLIGGESADELMAMPDDVAEFLASLRTSSPKNLAGIVWFRLPTEEDTRIWSLPTLRAVVGGTLPDRKIEASVSSGAIPGMLDIALVNRGRVDAPLPASLLLPPQCGLGDGINGYTSAREGGTIVLNRLQMGLLRGQHRLIVGWMRCKGGRPEIHVRP